MEGGCLPQRAMRDDLRRKCRVTAAKMQRAWLTEWEARLGLSHGTRVEV